MGKRNPGRVQGKDYAVMRKSERRQNLPNLASFYKKTGREWSIFVHYITAHYLILVKYGSVISFESPYVWPYNFRPMTNAISSLTTAQLRRAADLKEKIEALDQELASILGGSASVSVKTPKKKGGMSAAGRARIAAAQKARWAKVRASKPATKVTAKKNKMSAAGRAKIAAAQKARWAKVKAEKTKA